MPMSMDGGHEQIVSDGLVVKGPTHNEAQAKATDLMRYPSLPLGARKCHKFADHEMTEPLVSVPQLAGHGCTIVMNLT